MTNQPPDIIYLQYYGDDWYVDNIENPEPAEGDEVTWCVDKINEVDIKYLLATPQREAAPAMFEAIRLTAQEVGAHLIGATPMDIEEIHKRLSAFVELAGDSESEIDMGQVEANDLEWNDPGIIRR